MKKIFTLAILAVAMMVVTPANAQKLKFGVKGGLNVNKMKTNKDVVDTKNQAGFFIGPTIKLSTPTGLSCDIAALFDQRTSKVEMEDETNANIEHKATIKQNSIQIPINVRYGIGLGSTASVFIFAGPQFGFNIGDKAKTIYEEDIVEGKKTHKWTTNNSNLSINAGLGLSLLKHLQLTASYNFGVGKTGEFKEEWNESSTVDKGKTVRNIAKGRNNTWQLSLAYFF